MLRDTKCHGTTLSRRGEEVLGGSQKVLALQCLRVGFLSLLPPFASLRTAPLPRPGDIHH